MEQNNKSKQFEMELAKSKAEKTAEELKQFAGEEDIELSMDKLENVSERFMRSFKETADKH